MTPIDLLNWVGCRRRLRPLGVVLHWLALRVRLSTLVRCAGRRLVTASAGAPAILLTHPSMEGALKDPALLYEAMRFSVEEMKLDVFCLVADMSLEAEACGCLVQYNDRDLPMVISHPLEGDGDVDDLGVPDPHRDGRMPVFLETMKRIKRQYSMLRFAVVVGPFTLAAHLRGTQIYLDTATDREMAKRILDYCSETIILYAEALIEAGADFIILAEPTGSQLSPAAYDEFSQVYSRRIMASLSRPCALHVCGKADHIIEKMCESGADAISVDDVNIPRAIRRVPRDMLIIGNLSTLTFATGSPDEVRAETAQLLEAVRDRPEFSIAPGCDLATETPLENIQAFVQATREYG